MKKRGNRSNRLMLIFILVFLITFLILSFLFTIISQSYNEERVLLEQVAKESYSEDESLGSKIKNFFDKLIGQGEEKGDVGGRDLALQPVTCVDDDSDWYNQSAAGCGIPDCDDTTSLIAPNVIEACTNGIDDSCNGLIDGEDDICKPPANKLSRLLYEDDFIYLGSFRVPRDNRWAFGGVGLTYYSNGDGGSQGQGASDGYIGSLFSIGHASCSGARGDYSYNVVSEISIPAPVISATKNAAELPIAGTLQPFANPAGDLYISSDCIFTQWPPGDVADNLGDIFYMPKRGSQTTDKLYWTVYSYYNGGFTEFLTHGWSELDLVNPQPKGIWHHGPMYPGSGIDTSDYPYFANKYNDYMLEVPASWADVYSPGNYLGSGRGNKGAGAIGSSQGPALIVSSPWNDGNPPANGAILNGVPLIYYPARGANPYWEDAYYPNYRPRDEWNGAAWLTAGAKSAFIVAGMKGLGPGCYDFSGVPCTGRDLCESSKGYHSDPSEAQVLLYDPQDLAAVSQGTKNPWEVQPYAIFRPGAYLWPNCYPLFGGVGYDRERNILYLIQRSGERVDVNTPYPIVHVFKINANPPVCGNGIIEGSEGCDDSNTANGDGCSDICAIEAGWRCTEQPSVCVSCVDSDGDEWNATAGGTCGTVADCNDNNIGINPGALEICNDGIDNNCNNLIDAQDNACLPATITINSPTSGQVLTSSSVTVRYSESGNLVNVDHVHLQLDSEAEIRDLDNDGIYPFNNISNRNHTVRVYMADASHNQIGNVVTVSFSVNTAGSCLISDPAVILFTPFNDGTANDLSSSGNDGVVNDATWISGGKIGGAFSFDGINDYITISDGDNLDFETATEDFSVFAWIKTITPSDGDVIFQKMDTLGDGWRFILLGNGRVRAYINGTLAESNISVNDGQWHYVGAVADRNGNLRVYIDGVASGTGVSIAGQTMDIALQSSRIGAASYEPTFTLFNGDVDEAVIFSKALTASEVNELYNGNYCSNPICGNGLVEGNEQCDGNTRGCTTPLGYNGIEACNAQCDGFGSCVATEFCGDTIIQAGAGEQCDDGNTADLDGCSALCKNENPSLPPALNVISPEAKEYRNVPVPLTFLASNADNCYYILDSVRKDIICNVNEILNLNYTLNVLQSHKIEIFANNSNGEVNQSINFSVYRNRKYIVKYGKFSNKGATTNLDNLEDKDLENASLTLDDGLNGKIEFIELINLTSDANETTNETDIDFNVNISDKRIEIDTNNLKGLNKKARLTFRNINFNDPKTQKDGVDCSAVDCVEISYTAPVYVVDVSGFSVYTVVEGEEQGDGDGDGGGGGGGGGGGTPKPIIPEVEKVNESLLIKGEIKKVIISEELTSIDIEKGESVLFDLDGALYEIIFGISADGVIIKSAGKDYLIANRDVLSVLMGEKEVYIGVEKLENENAGIIVGLDGNLVKESLGQGNIEDEGTPKKYFGLINYIFIGGLVLLIILVGIILIKLLILNNKKKKLVSFKVFGVKKKL